MVAPASQSPAQPANRFPVLRQTLLALALAFSTAPAFAAGKAAVAAPDEYGARIAMEVMGHGGNAVDAAVATAFVLAVTYPEAGNLGGGGFMMIYRDGKPACLDYRETAPAAATRDMYLDAKGAVIKNSSTIGPRAAGVPGTVAGMWVAHQRYGKRPWRELLQPAIKLAREGFEPSAEMAKRISEARGSYTGITNFDQYFGAVQAGTVFRQPELAATLERIAAGGPDGFYKGKTAQLVVAQMGHGGLIALSDLAGYKAKWREPMTARWRGMEILDGTTAELRRLRADRAARDARCARAAVYRPRAQLHAVRAPDRGDGKARIR